MDPGDHGEVGFARICFANPPSCARSACSDLEAPPELPALSGSNLTLSVKTQDTLTGAWCFGGEGGIRTHVRLPVNAFRVRRVMTTSLPLHTYFPSLPHTRDDQSRRVRGDVFMFVLYRPPSPPLSSAVKGSLLRLLWKTLSSLS